MPPGPLHHIRAVGKPLECGIVGCLGPLLRFKSNKNFLMMRTCVITQLSAAFPKSSFLNCGVHVIPSGWDKV